ncbi:MAG: glycosyltransferase [Acidimicrobiales bacterium]
MTVSTTPLLSVVVPAHNEVSLLGSTVTNLATGLAARSLAAEIIVVENGSRDGTLRLARLLASQIPELRVLSLPTANYGAALAAGFAAARGDVVVNVDVDYYDLAFVDVALEAIRAGRADVVLASKRVAGSRDRRPVVRRVLTLGFVAASRLLIGIKVSDAHGMKALDRAALATVVAACVMRGSLFDVEMVLRAERAGLVTAEIPAVVAERRPPRTPVWRRGVESLAGLIVLRLRLGAEARRRRTPGAVSREDRDARGP